MTHSYVWHDSFICVTWLIHMCDMTHSYVWHDSFICVTWLIHMYDMTHSYAWRDSFICVTWLIQMCDMTLSYVWHNSFMCVWHDSHSIWKPPCPCPTCATYCNLSQPVPCGCTTCPFPQGALCTSNQNVVIPQWTVGCRNRRIPRIPQIFPESRGTRISKYMWYQVFYFQDIKYFGYKPALPKKTNDFCAFSCCLWSFRGIDPSNIAIFWVSV